MNLKKEQLRKILDDYVKLKGIRETLSDLAIGFVVDFVEENIWDHITEQDQKRINDWIDGNSNPPILKSNGDPGQGPGGGRPPED